MQIDSTTLKSALALIESQLSGDLLIDSDETGWHIRAMDPSHVAFASVEIPAASFGDYVVWDDVPIDLDKMLKAIAGKGDTLDLVLGEGTLSVRGNGLTTKIRLNARCPEKPRAFPELENEATVIINTTDLKQVVKAIEGQVGLAIDVTEEGLTISGYNEDGAGSQLDVAADDCVALDGVAHAMYPISMVREFCKALPDKMEIEIGFGTARPATFKYDLPGAHCCWMVAPWVEED